MPTSPNPADGIQRGDLENAHVVERALPRVEVGIAPDRAEFGIADRVAPGCLRDVDAVADERLAAAVTADLAVVGHRDVVDPL